MKSLNECGFKIGDLVDFKAKSSEEGYTKLVIKEDRLTKVVKSGQTQLVSPTMVIAEIVRENIREEKLFDRTTGKKVKDPIKIRCIWFSFRQGKFLERWFNIGAIVRAQLEQPPESSHALGDINEVVTLRTYLGAFKEFEVKYDSTQNPEDDTLQSSSITQVFSNLSFIPPKMVITAIKSTDNNKPLFDKVTKEPIRKIVEKQAKCMWYDPKSGKFSEVFLPLDCLISVDNLPNINSIVTPPSFEN